MTETPDLALAGRRWAAANGAIRIGRAPTCEAVIEGAGVADHHATATPEGGRWVVRPSGPAASLWVGQRRREVVTVDGPTQIAFGDPNGVTLDAALLATEQGPTSARIRVGRARDNDLVVPDLLVSRYHAEVRWDGFGWSLLDLGSPYGTYVDGRWSPGGELHFGQRVTFGNASFVVTRAGLTPVDATRASADTPPALAAEHLSVVVDGGVSILSDVSLAVRPGELVAIVGPSGSGKSTLLNALTGSRNPEFGAVKIRGIDLYEAYDELCRSIGYVPQDDILHLPLSIRQALLFGAELRFPEDTTDEDRQERVDEVLAQLELSHRADVPIETISGGQRKRTSVALELLTRPDLLFLDEPTSGLDPGFERTVMELLRDLATGGRAVVVVTHSLQSLDLCDRVLFLAPGGTIAFSGRPADALRYFGRDDFVDVFRDLEDSSPATWQARRSAEPATTPPAAAPNPVVPPAAPPGQPWGRQVSILARRHLAILRADRQNLGFLFLGVVIPAVLILLLTGTDILSLGQADPVTARVTLGAMVVAAVAIGTANAIREVVKELPIYHRERSIGLQRSAYLTAKLLVIGALTTAQALVLVLIATARAGGPDRANVLVIPHLELIVDVVLTGLAAVALGLLLSTIVSSSEKAMVLVPVVFVVQWLFSGAALDLQSKPVLREVAMVTSANWGMAASASSVGEHELSQTCSYPPQYPEDAPDPDDVDPLDPEAQQEQATSEAEVEAKRDAEDARRDAAPACDRRWRSEAGEWLHSILALLVLIVVPVWLADRRLARREPLPSRRAPDWPLPGRRGPRRQF